MGTWNWEHSSAQLRVCLVQTLLCQQHRQKVKQRDDLLHTEAQYKNEEEQIKNESLYHPKCDMNMRHIRSTTHMTMTEIWQIADKW